MLHAETEKRTERSLKKGSLGKKPLLMVAIGGRVGGRFDLGELPPPILEARGLDQRTERGGKDEGTSLHLLPLERTTLNQELTAFLLILRTKKKKREAQQRGGGRGRIGGTHRFAMKCERKIRGIEKTGEDLGRCVTKVELNQQVSRRGGYGGARKERGGENRS